MPVVRAMQRIALYSHDSQGLGHLRRNLAIAEAFSRTPGRAVLLLTGAREAGVFSMPPGTDCLSLPALHKAEGRYAPRSLGLELGEVIDLRSDMIRAALTRFAPDLLIVDKHPLGVHGEMEPALRALAGNARVVLGLREVLDDPAVVAREWRRERTVESIHEHYDAVPMSAPARTCGSSRCARRSAGASTPRVLAEHTWDAVSIFDPEHANV